MRPIDVLTSPWAIVPEKLQEIINIYSTHLRGEKIDVKPIEAALGRPLQNDEQGYEIREGVALIPIDGVIAKKMNLFTRISGGVSTELVARDIRQAVQDPRVNAIILLVDSPGGTVDGTQGLAGVVAAANERKPVVTFADGMMASAAYWIGAAADRVLISGDTTYVGSIGVVATHVDVSKYEEKIGVKTTEIYAGKYKRIASEYQPLSIDGRDYIQSMVDQLYSVFVGEVAKFRGVSEETVLKDMADGRVFIGKKALEAGLVDGVSTLDALIADLSGGTYERKRRGAGAAAAANEATGAGDAPQSPTTSTGDLMITKEQIEKDHPAIVEALRAEGRAGAADAERNRIKDVRAQLMPGHEALVETLMFDGKTTGPEAAVAVLAAEKATNAAAHAALKGDAPQAVPAAPSPGGDQPAAPAAPGTGASIEEQCKAKWESDGKIRAEFVSFDSYIAFEKAHADGKVRILGAKAA